MAAAISTLAVSLFYLLAQMAGAGGLVTLLLGVSGEAAQAVVVTIVGALMIFYVLVGGMRGTTYVQIIKASLLIVGAFVMTVWVLGKYGFNLSALLGGAQENAGGQAATSSRPGRSTARPGRRSWTSSRSAWPWCSGTAGLPHVLMRFYTVPTAKDARRSVVWAIWLIGIFYLFSLVIGYGAGALVGADEILAAPGAVNAAAPLLAFELGGTVLLGHHRRRRLRDDPRGGRRPDDHRVGVVRARRLRVGDQEGQGRRRTARCGSPASPPSSSARSRSAWASWRCRPA